jgi:hypothetical protein
VPEATVHENDNSLLAEDKVGAAEQPCSAAPSDYSVVSKNLYETHLGAAIPSRSNRGHDSRSGRGWKDVRHQKEVGNEESFIAP